MVQNSKKSNFSFEVEFFSQIPFISIKCHLEFKKDHYPNYKKKRNLRKKVLTKTILFTIYKIIIQSLEGEGWRQI